MRIWKYQLAGIDKQTVMMPTGSKLLDVQMQKDACCLWVLCDEGEQLKERIIAIYGTGHPMPDDPGDYIATFQMMDGSLVFHAFEIFK
jgi:hypothetical protein